MFDWGDGSRSPWSPFFPSDSLYATTHTFRDTLKFYVRVKARDIRNKEGQWLTKELRVISPYSGMVLWRFRCEEEGIFVSSPAIGSDGTIYCGCTENHLHALTPDGKEKTGFPFTTDAAIVSSPLIDDNGNIIFGTEDGILYSISPQGTLIWWLDLNTPILSSPGLGQNGDIYLSTAESLYGISGGQIIFRVGRPGGFGLSSPVVDIKGTIFVGGEVFSAYTPEGVLKWEIPLSDEARSSPAIDALGRVYFGCDDGSFYCLDNQGNIVFLRNLQDPITTSPVIFGKFLIVSNDEGKVFCFDTSRVSLWEFDAKGQVLSTPLISNLGEVYIAVDYGKQSGDSLIALSLNDGQRIFATEVALESYEELTSSPALANGVIYIGEDGGLVAIIGRGNLPTEGWPMFRKDLRHTGRE